MSIGREAAFGLITAALLMLGSSTASSLSIDARIGGVFEDTTFATPAAGAVIAGSGNVYNYAAQSGQGVFVTIDIANPSADLISGIFVSMVVQSDELILIGANASAEILAGGTIFNPTSLNDIGSGRIKSNGPGPPGEVWIQAVAYGSGSSSNGTGPESRLCSCFSRLHPVVNTPACRISSFG
jgi:hypothetical protein